MLRKVDLVEGRRLVDAYMDALTAYERYDTRVELLVWLEGYAGELLDAAEGAERLRKALVFAHPDTGE